MRFGLHRVYLALCSRKGANDTRENHRSKRSRMAMTPTKEPRPKVLQHCACRFRCRARSNISHPTAHSWSGYGSRSPSPAESSSASLSATASQSRHRSSRKSNRSSRPSTRSRCYQHAIFDLCLWSAQYYLHPMWRGLCRRATGQDQARRSPISKQLERLVLGRAPASRHRMPPRNDVKRSP